MKFEDVTTLTRQALAQSMGATYMTEHGYLENIPAEKLIDIGKDINNSADVTVELYTKSCLSLLAKHVIDEGKMGLLFDDLEIDRVEWGGFIERSKIDYSDIMDDPVLSVADGVDFSSIEHTFYQPKVKTKIYDEGKGICTAISIQRQNLTEAFNSWDSMNAYLSKIRAKVKMTIKKALDRYASVLVEGGIAVSVMGTQTAVYLLDEAETLGIDGITSSTTPIEALQNNAYLAYVGRRISEIRTNMKVDSTCYNDGTWATASPDARLYLNTQYSRALQFGVFANTYNKEDVKFGEYKELPIWQAVKNSSGDKFDYSTATAIRFAADSSNKLGLGTSAIEIDNVIGFLFDPMAIGYTMYKEYTTTSYTACADFWNEFVHVLVNMILDSGYPMVAFINGRAS